MYTLQVVGGSVGQQVSFLQFKAFNQLLGNLDIMEKIVNETLKSNPKKGYVTKDVSVCLCTRASIRVCMCVYCMCVYYMCVHTCMYKCAHVRTFMCLYVCGCMHVYAHVRTFTCVYVHGRMWDININFVHLSKSKQWRGEYRTSL